MNVELIYFEVQGRATQTRLMLKLGGIEFTDTCLTAEKWVEKKASFDEIALGQLPVLKINDKVYCQSDAIMEWAAAKAKLIPENDDDQLAMRMVIGRIFIY